MKPYRVMLTALLTATLAFAAAPPPVRGDKAMATSRSTIASQVGADIMRQGGNAVDAAVAMGFALAVTYPSAGNLGGGGFMVLHLADGTDTTLDFREVAPSSAHKEMYLDENGAVVKGLSTSTRKSTGVPGTVDGLIRALETHGTMKLKQVIAPAIELARDGFPLSYELVEQFNERMEYFEKYPASKAVFTNDGALYKVGDVWKQPDLAGSLERIAEHGRDGFYTGETAELIVAEMKRGQGEISLEDLKKYRSKWRDPVRGTYRGHEIVSMPPPSSGGVLLIQMLNMIEPHDIAEMGWGSADAIHLMVEAERRAYADRAEFLGDPDFVEVPMAKLMDKAYAKERMKSFSPIQATDSDDIGHGTWPEESPETTHYAAADHLGNAVAVTTTLNWSFGTRIVVEGAGFLLNNEMDDFSVKPNVPNSYGLIGRQANSIAPGKRMLSSMTPTIIKRDGKPFLLLGSPGGSTIITTVFQVAINVIDHEMDISSAVNMPRFHHQWKPNRIIYEPHAIPPDAKTILELRGHQNIRGTSWKIGDANSILIEGDLILGTTDARHYARAVGF